MSVLQDALESLWCFHCLDRAEQWPLRSEWNKSTPQSHALSYTNVGLSGCKRIDDEIQTCGNQRWLKHLLHSNLQLMLNGSLKQTRYWISSKGRQLQRTWRVCVWVTEHVTSELWDSEAELFQVSSPWGGGGGRTGHLISEMSIVTWRGQWPVHESIANEATHELGGYHDWSSWRTCFQEDSMVIKQCFWFSSWFSCSPSCRFWHHTFPWKLLSATLF